MKRWMLSGAVFFLFSCTLLFSRPGMWMEDYAKASALAQSSGKILLINFSGSDWCRWCIKLDKEVFSTKAFQKYAKKNLILFLADFPRGKKLSEAMKKQNDDLAQKYGIEGFPTVILLSPKGEKIGQTGYRDGGAEAYVKHLQEIIAENKSGQK